MDQIGRLIRELPLPPGWEAPEAFTDVIDIEGTPIRRAGIQSRNASGVEATGSAAVRQGDALQRAWLELLERAAVIEAGGRAPSPSDRSRPSRSNGVAVQSSWTAACNAARQELVERDRVLRSWYGQLPLHAVSAPAWLATIASHEWRCCLVGSRGADLEVAVVIGFPRSSDLPLARGFAARLDAPSAVDGAAAEAVQSLAFLWGLPVPDEPPMESPTPMFHLDYYLYPPHQEALCAWLDGSNLRDGGAPCPADPEVCFEDLTPETYKPAVFVARATSPELLELVFGEPPREVPQALRVHPIS